jgi:hypothetical protein
MRSMKKSEIKILSLAKFTAAIDVGIWSENNNYSDPKEFYKDYENLTPEPKVIFRLHESNFQQFLDVDSIRSIFSKKSKKRCLNYFSCQKSKIQQFFTRFNGDSSNNSDHPQQKRRSFVRNRKMLNNLR